MVGPTTQSSSGGSERERRPFPSPAPLSHSHHTRWRLSKKITKDPPEKSHHAPALGRARLERLARALERDARALSGDGDVATCLGVSDGSRLHAKGAGRQATARHVPDRAVGDLVRAALALLREEVGRAPLGAEGQGGGLDGHAQLREARDLGVLVAALEGALFCFVWVFLLVWCCWCGSGGGDACCVSD